MIVEEDRKGGITCQVTSSTHGSKTRTNVVVSKGKYYLKQNNFQDVSIFNDTKTNNLVILLNHNFCQGYSCCHHLQSYGHNFRSRNCPDDWNWWSYNDGVCSFAGGMSSSWNFYSATSFEVNIFSNWSLIGFSLIFVSVFLRSGT